MAKSIYGPQMAKNSYGPPMAKHSYGPQMAKISYGPQMAIDTVAAHLKEPWLLTQSLTFLQENLLSKLLLLSARLR